MATQQQVIEKLRGGLQKAHAQSGISLNEMSIKLTIHKRFPVDGVHIKLNQLDIEKGDIAAETVFGITSMEAFAIRPRLACALKKYAANLGIAQDTVNARIYACSANFEPAIDIYTGNQKLKETNAAELMAAL